MNFATEITKAFSRTPRITQHARRCIVQPGTTEENHMSQFSIPEMTAVTVRTVNLRSELHGEDHVPAADIFFKLTASNEWLTEFHPALRSMFYTKPEAAQPDQAQIEGFELTDMPLLRCNVVKMPLKLSNEYVGYDLEIDRGLGGASNIRLSDAKLDKFSVELKEGGSVEFMFKASVSNLQAPILGSLGTLIGCEVSITCTPPEPKQAPIDGTVVAFERDTKGKAKDATEAYLDAQA